MDCKAELGADAEHCVHGVGSGTQMRNGAQKLHRVIFLLKRIIRRAIAQKLYLVGVDFKLALFHCGNDRALRNYGRAVFHDRRKSVLIEFGFVYDDLQMFERRAVVECQKRHCFAVARSAYPARHRDVLALVLCAVFQNFGNVDVLHKLPHYV